MEEAIDNAVMVSQGRMAATEEAEVDQNSGVEEQVGWIPPSVTKNVCNEK